MTAVAAVAVWPINTYIFALVILKQSYHSVCGSFLLSDYSLWGCFHWKVDGQCKQEACKKKRQGTQYLGLESLNLLSVRHHSHNDICTFCCTSPCIFDISAGWFFMKSVWEEELRSILICHQVLTIFYFFFIIIFKDRPQWFVFLLTLLTAFVKSQCWHSEIRSDQILFSPPRVANFKWIIIWLTL